MKKIIALFAIVSMFAFVACNNAPKEDPAAEAEAAAAEAAAMEAEKAAAEAAAMDTTAPAEEAVAPEANAEGAGH